MANLTGNTGTTYILMGVLALNCDLNYSIPVIQPENIYWIRKKHLVHMIVATMVYCIICYVYDEEAPVI